jgi:biopolymer transport protein TolR
MHSLRAGRVSAEPNVTPMIDVMLVLLVIFMIVIPAIADGAATVPPQADSLRARPEEEGDRTLTIDRDGRHYLNRVYVPADSLLATLRIAAASKKDDYVLYVRADKGLEYQVVRDALGTAGSAGIRVVALVSEKPPVSPKP